MSSCSGQFDFKKGDIIAAAVVAVIAAGIFFYFISFAAKSGGTAKIYLNGELVKETGLSKDQSFVIEGEYKNEITVEDGKIFVSASNCPGQDCVHSGKKSKAGESIICLPNWLEIRISGEAEVDFVTGK